MLDQLAAWQTLQPHSQTTDSLNNNCICISTLGATVMIWEKFYVEIQGVRWPPLPLPGGAHFNRDFHVFHKTSTPWIDATGWNLHNRRDSCLKSNMFDSSNTVGISVGADRTRTSGQRSPVAHRLHARRDRRRLAAQSTIAPTIASCYEVTLRYASGKDRSSGRCVTLLSLGVIMQWFDGCLRSICTCCRQLGLVSQ